MSAIPAGEEQESGVTWHPDIPVELRDTVTQGEALSLLARLPDHSIDAIVADPPYACVERSYGRWTEAEWMTLMQATVRECRRVLKPSGSAVFVLQPNFERLGKMRLWMWRFLIWAAEEWNLVQDAYWWNYTTMPGAGVQREHGLLRSSVKMCVWLGAPDCYRNQDAVLWRESDANLAQRVAYRAGEDHSGIQPSGHSRDRGKMAGTASTRVYPSGREKDWESITRERRVSGWSVNPAAAVSAAVERGNSAGQNFPSGWSKDESKIADAFGGRGLVTPFNLIPISNANSTDSAGSNGHGAGTPLALCRWWVRYLCPVSTAEQVRVVCDPFAGSGTTGIAARREGRNFIGFEKEAAYVAMARRRLAAEAQEMMAEMLETA